MKHVSIMVILDGLPFNMHPNSHNKGP